MIARLRAFGAFWYDFVVGDDWRVAVAVVAALAITYGIAFRDSGVVGVARNGCGPAAVEPMAGRPRPPWTPTSPPS